MTGREREPTEADGPLLRAARRRAKQIGGAQGPVRHRNGWAAFLALAAAAVAESILRELFIGVAALSSLLAIVFGVAAGGVAWAVPMSVCGAAGVALVVWATTRRWAFARQWAVLLGVLVVQVALIVALWRAR